MPKCLYCSQCMKSTKVDKEGYYVYFCEMQKVEKLPLDKCNLVVLKK